MQTDPIGYEDQMNLYAYVHNDPMSYTDSTGEIANFAIKFVADVALGATLNYLETGELNLGSAVADAAIGVINPAKTLQKAQRIAKVLKKTCCFVAGTQVLTETGYKNIEDVKLGEKLWAKNVETGEQDWKPVTKVWVEPDRGIYEIKLIGQDGIEQKIEATDDHPFYVVGDGWKTTAELSVGDYIETDGDGSMIVTSVIDEKRQGLTYNFTIADFHTYYVTKQNVLVHNCNKIKISSQKRNAHVNGTKEHQRRVDNGTPTSTFDNRKTADDLTADTVATGTKSTDSAGNVTYRKEYGERVGSGPNGGAQTQVKVHQDSKGVCHGHPCGPES